MKKIKLKKKTKTANDNTNKRKEKKTIWQHILSVILLLAILFVSACLLFALYIVISSPDFEKKKLFQVEPTILYDKNGNEFARVGSKDSTIVTYDEIPDVVVDALIATEDSRFFQHNGLDLFRFLKASVLQALHMSYAGGASTLSMQVIKNTYTDSTSHGIKGIIRKFTDIYMAVFKLEANYTKEEIIEFYLNSQWFANNGNINVSNGIFGIEQASLHYFGKSSKDMNLAEASLIVGMFQNSRLYNPYRNPEGCRNRQKTVLNLLVRHGYITESQKNAVLKIPVSSMLIDHDNAEGTVNVNSNQAFIDYVLDEIENDLKIDPRQGSLKIYTTYDPNVQSVLEKVENGDMYAFLDDTVQEGIAVTDTVDGSISALSGGRNYLARGLNRATDISRQPGSTAKPLFDYAMYIEHISQSSYAMFLDEHTTYTNGSPISDYDNRYKGLITMRYALEDSRNIPALLAFKEVAKIDQKIIENFVHSIGIDYGKDLFESASIGGFNGVSPLEMSAAYATFGRGGYYIKPYAYTKVVNTSTGDEYNHSYSKEKVMEESTAYIMNNILIGVYGGKGVAGTQIGGKTGTTNLDSDTKKRYGLPNGAVMDAWIVSYSPSHSIALWYGYDKLSSESAANKHYLTSNTGGTARRQIMNGLATKIHQKNKTFNIPKTVTVVNVELETFPAQLCSPYTPDKMCVSETFVKGTEPTDVSKRYDTLDNPTNGNYNFNGNSITLKWDAISTPDAINNDYLLTHYNENYKEHADKYYNARLAYNSANIGQIGYDVYLKTSSGEQYLGYTTSNTYSYNVPSGGEYTFIIKSAYSIFKYNRSSGLTITAKTIDTTIPGGPTTPEPNPNPGGNNNPTTPPEDNGLN